VYVRWEDRPEIKANPKLIEDLKMAYLDPTLTLDLIAANFEMSKDSVSTVAVRLGCPPRHTAKARGRPSPGTSITDIEARMEALKTELANLAQKKLDLVVKAERRGEYITAYGLPEILEFSVEVWVNWLKAGGPQKVRQKIREDEW
jgi:hypothetical protein